MALGAVYGTLELSSAISGKDWISGRELDTNERWVRGALAPIDIIPGAGAAVTRFAGVGATGLVRLGGKWVPTGLKTGVKGSIQKGVTSVNNLTETASKLGTARLRSAGAVITDRANMVKNKLAKNTNGGTCILLNSRVSIKLVFMEQVHQQIHYLKEVKNNEL